MITRENRAPRPIVVNPRHGDINCVLRPFTLGLCFVLVACRAKFAPGEPSKDSNANIVATVDGRAITTADIEQYLAKQPAPARARYATRERRRELLDTLIRFEVMAREAERHGYDKDPEVLRLAKQQMVNQFVQRDIEGRFRPEDVPDAEAEAYYKDHVRQFSSPEQVRVSQIVVEDKVAATRVVAAVKALAPRDEAGFRTLATRYSEDPLSRARGGELPLLERTTPGQPPAVVHAAFALTENTAQGGSWQSVKLDFNCTSHHQWLQDEVSHLARRTESLLILSASALAA